MLLVGWLVCAFACVTVLVLVDAVKRWGEDEDSVMRRVADLEIPKVLIQNKVTDFPRAKVASLTLPPQTDLCKGSKKSRAVRLRGQSVCARRAVWVWAVLIRKFVRAQLRSLPSLMRLFL